MSTRRPITAVLVLAVFFLDGCPTGLQSYTPPPAGGPTGNITTLAGGGRTGILPGHLEGTGTAATFNGPYALATDGTNLYVADSQNNKIRKVVIGSGVVSTLAGGGGVGGVAAGHGDATADAATFDLPWGLAIAGANLYVADRNNCTIRQIVISTGVVTTIAGGGSVGGTAPGHADGTGVAATFNSPPGIVSDGTNLYVADSGNNTIRQIVISTGVVTTIAGGGGVGGTAPGHADGTGVAATFSVPIGIAAYGTSLYVADFSNNTIRWIQ